MLEKIVTVLYLSGEPILLSKIAQLLEVKEEDVVASLPLLEERLSLIGLALLRVGHEAAIVTKAEYAPIVEAFRKEELRGDLTPATLQVLTLVAYLGEISRENISYIRGVQSAQSIRSLSIRGFLVRKGELCSLTGEALSLLGVTKKEDLPDYEKISQEFLKKLKEKEE